MASIDVLEAWHLTVAEHLALVRDVLMPVARLHASTELACSGQPCCVQPVLTVATACSVPRSTERFLVRAKIRTCQAFEATMPDPSIDPA